MASKVEHIQVAVRVRPFNEREKARQCQCVVSMDGARTTITDLNAGTHSFEFDHSYWSHDGYKLVNGYLVPERDSYVDQERVYSDLGAGMVENAWEGFNCSIFAYGQTGSGKSYSIMGNDVNKGLVPRICEHLFDSIEQRDKTSDEILAVSFSMLEIYNEKVRDLLTSKPPPTQGLPVRDHKQTGFYVPDLTVLGVRSFKDINALIQQGNRNRTIAATKMNETSSRAHTIVTVKFTQIRKAEGKTTESLINLVDLAGSERVAKTGAEGQQLIEGNKINLSLSNLGKVIRVLCGQAAGKTNLGAIPYRDSKLTMLLKNAIGGNSKTSMLATITPSHEEYQESLSTLRYADSAKQIRNQAKINVGDTAKLIQELLKEKKELLSQLQNFKQSSSEGYTRAEISDMQAKQQAEIERLQKEMSDVESAWQETLEKTKKKLEGELALERKEKEDRVKNPHLWNLNEDPSLTAKVYHILKQGTNVTVGSSKAKPKATIELYGPNITREHAVIQNRKGKVYVKSGTGVVMINGQEISKETRLSHQDRVLFGSSSLFVFHDPVEQEKLTKQGKKLEVITYEFAQAEMGKENEINKKTDDVWLKREIATLSGRLQDANTMSIELQRNVTFEPVLLSQRALGHDSDKSEVYVRVKTETGMEFLWTSDKFLDRYDVMMDMYQRYESNDPSWDMKNEQDPFWEPASTQTIIGVAHVSLEALAHMLDIKRKRYKVYDHKWEEAGSLTVSVIPCTEGGKECGEDRAVDKYADLVGTDITFKLKIEGASAIPKRFETSWCVYQLFSEEPIQTEEKPGRVPQYNFEHLHRVKSISMQTVEFLAKHSLPIKVLGRQKDLRPIKSDDAGVLDEELKKQMEAQLAEIKDLKRELTTANKKLDKIKTLVQPKSDDISKKIKEFLQ